MVCSVKISISLNQENISEGLLNSDFKSGMAVISGVGWKSISQRPAKICDQSGW